MAYKFQDQRSLFGNILVWDVLRSARSIYFSFYGGCGCDVLRRSMALMHNGTLWKISTIEFVKYVAILAHKAVIEGNKRERLIMVSRTH